MLPIVTDCEGCCACCLHMGYPTFVQGTGAHADEVHWTSLPSELKQELVAFMAQYDAPAPGQLDGPCFWLDTETRRCKYHKHRPQVCRDFQVGGQDCLAWRDCYGPSSTASIAGGNN